MPRVSAKIESKLSAEEQEQMVASFLKELGARLKQKRKAVNISQLELSGHIGKDDTSCNDSFDNAVRIISIRERRRNKKAVSETDKTLTARIYEVGGKEVREEIKRKEKTRKDKYRSAEISTQVEPFSKEEFCDYINRFDEETKDSVIKGGGFLEQIENRPKKAVLADVVADYIVDEIVINRVSVNHPDEASKRAYAYYKRLRERMDEVGPDEGHNADE